jgi:hypothetical protein
LLAVWNSPSFLWNFFKICLNLDVSTKMHLHTTKF